MSNNDSFEICGRYNYSVYEEYTDKSIPLNDFINDRVDAFIEMMDYMDSEESTCKEIRAKALDFWKNLRSVDVWTEMILFAVGPEANSRKKSIHDRLWKAYTTYMNLLLDNYPKVNHFRKNLLFLISETVKCKTRNNIPIG